MSDILERLRAPLDLGDGASVALLIDDACAEIERLRALVGAASAGASFADIKRDAKTAPAPDGKAMSDG